MSRNEDWSDPLAWRLIRYRVYTLLRATLYASLTEHAKKRRNGNISRPISDDDDDDVVTAKPDDNGGYNARQVEIRDARRVIYSLHQTLVEIAAV